jgi:hypothetical protein
MRRGQLKLRKFHSFLVSLGTGMRFSTQWRGGWA